MSDAIAAADDPDAPEGALEEAFLLYRDAGLRLPPVPRELADSLSEQADWEYSSAPADLSDRAGFLADAAKPGADLAVAFGHTGHGVASWYLCYRLIRGPLAVYLRQRFGNAFDTEETGHALVNATMIAVEDLIVAADAAQQTGRIGPGQRLLVVVDDLEGSGWRVLGAPGSTWHKDEVPLIAAADFLAGNG